jgi:molybdopterin/thiamine biosynthesis adenylyltransferase
VNFWWLTDFARLGREKAAVEELAAETDWFTLTRWTLDNSRLAAEGVLTAHGAVYPVLLVYPDLFPAVPAWVRPQDSEARWSGHQFGDGGSLCLELRSDNWSPSATGADLLRSAHSLLEIENPLGAGEHPRAPSAHHVGEVQGYDLGLFPVLIRAGCFERLGQGLAEAVIGMRWLAGDDVWPILIYDAIDQAQGQHPPAFDLSSLSHHAIPVLVSTNVPSDEPPAGRAALLESLGLKTEAGPDTAVVVIATGGERPKIYHSPNAKNAFVRKWIVLADDRAARSGRPATAAAKRVAIIGLGSVGSKIAEVLVRAGAARLHLVDGDVMLPGNLERHVLDWRDVGFRKVTAMRRRLLHIVPGADITIAATNLDWQRSARVAAAELDDIAACDLIVDATGSATASLLLGAVASEFGKAFVSVEAFEGGLGCLIARFLPGRDPSYLAGRLAYHAYCNERAVEPPPSGRARYEAFTEDGEPLVADDAAITIAAGHAARVALDVLDEAVGADEAAWLLMGFKAGWLFSRHGELIALDVGPAPVNAPSSDDAAAKAFAFGLVKEAANATYDPA